MNQVLEQVAAGLFVLAGGAYFISAGYYFYNRGRRALGVVYAVFAVLLAWQSMTVFQSDTSRGAHSIYASKALGTARGPGIDGSRDGDL